jgi:chitin deacetylase
MARYCGRTGEHCATSSCQPLYGTCNGNEIPLSNAVVARSSTASIQRVKFGSVPYGGSQVTGIKDCTTKGVIALTFDDGPSTYTRDLLDLLDRYNAKATFFISKDPQSSDSQY